MATNRFHELAARIYGIDAAPNTTFAEDYDGIKTVGGPKTSLVTRTRAVNKYLADISSSYHEHIPLADIFAKLKENGMTAVQEDGTEWEGLLLGRDGKANIELRTGEAKRWLSLSYHKMEVSGRYEVTAYVS